MCQDRQSAQAPVSLSSFQAKGEPVPDAEVDSFTNTKAIGEATMVGTREGDDVLSWRLYNAPDFDAYTVQSHLKWGRNSCYGRKKLLEAQIQLCQNVPTPRQQMQLPMQNTFLQLGNICGKVRRRLSN